MAENQKFTATVRESTGKGSAKAARREGQVPCVVYGADKDPVAIAVSSDDAKAIVDHPAILSLDVNGTEHAVLHPPPVEQLG